jgi:SAM-dependent methyltransferase
MLHSRVIMAGVRLGVFASLAGGPLAAGALAGDLGLDPLGTRLLCDALVAARYLRRDRQGRYSLRPAARRFLVPDAPHYVGHYVEYNYDQWAWMGGLEEAVRTGRALDVHSALEGNGDGAPAGSWSRYLEGLADLARGAAGEIAARVPLPPRVGRQHRRLLDVGGGHGTFSVALCRRHPDLLAEVLDLPPAVAAGEPIARRAAGAAVAGRIRYRAGDALAGPLGPDGGYDAVLVSQLLHHLPPAGVPDLLRRAVAVLRPGGWLAVIDLLEPARGRPPNATAAYTALHFFLSSHGRSFTPEEVEAALRAAGCARVRRIPLLRVPGQPLLAGQRPVGSVRVPADGGD